MNIKRKFSFIISIFVFACFAAFAPPIEDSFVLEVVNAINYWSREAGREIDGVDYSKEDLDDVILPKNGGYMEVSYIRRKKCFAEPYYSGDEVGVLLDAYNSRVVIFLERYELACIGVIFKDFNDIVIERVLLCNGSRGIACYIIVAVMGLKLDTMNAVRAFKDIINNQREIYSELKCAVSPRVKENLFKDPLNTRYLANESDSD